MNYPNIAIVSYNILWELMEKSNSKSKGLIDYLIKSDKNNMKENMLKNITNVTDYYNPQIYCFQEASGYESIIKLFNRKIYSYHANKSGPEHMLTIWNHDRFSLIKTFDGEFESGRPFCIFIFKDNLTTNKFILINLHAGHHKDTAKSIFLPIQNLLDKSEEIYSDKFNGVNRIILVGDFNRDINDQNKINNYSLVLTNTKFNFQYYNKRMSNTCCDTMGNLLNRNYDQVIDSYKTPLIRHELNKESWYNYPSSDHVMIMGILKKL